METLPVPRRSPRGRRDAYQEITGRIILALEHGTVPWRTPWGARGHRNARSGRPYRGINTLVLSMSALERGWDDPRWLTYRQSEAAGGHVRRGEHGTRVVLWKWIERKDSDDPETPERYPLLRLFTVFNVAQCAGLELPPVDGVVGPDPLERAEAIVRGYAGGPTVRLDADCAYYLAAQDEVHLPPRDAFADADGYYATLLHELAHSTGHPRRLAREGYQAAAPLRLGALLPGGAGGGVRGGVPRQRSRDRPLTRRAVRGIHRLMAGGARRGTAVLRSSPRRRRSGRPITSSGTAPRRR